MPYQRALAHQLGFESGMQHNSLMWQIWGFHGINLEICHECLINLSYERDSIIIHTNPRKKERKLVWSPILVMNDTYFGISITIILRRKNNCLTQTYLCTLHVYPFSSQHVLWYMWDSMSFHSNYVFDDRCFVTRIFKQVCSLTLLKC